MQEKKRYAKFVSKPNGGEWIFAKAWIGPHELFCKNFIKFWIDYWWINKNWNYKNFAIIVDEKNGLAPVIKSSSLGKTEKNHSK